MSACAYEQNWRCSTSDRPRRETEAIDVWFVPALLIGVLGGLFLLADLIRHLNRQIYRQNSTGTDALIALLYRGNTASTSELDPEAVHVARFRKLFDIEPVE